MGATPPTVLWSENTNVCMWFGHNPQIIFVTFSPVKLSHIAGLFYSQGHNFYKLKYISLEEVKIVPFQL